MRWLAPVAALALSAQAPIPYKDFGDFCVATAYELCSGDECVAPSEKRDLTITLDKGGRNAHVCEGGTCMEGRLVDVARPQPAAGWERALERFEYLSHIMTFEGDRFTLMLDEGGAIARWRGTCTPASPTANP